jgi:integrase
MDRVSGTVDLPAARVMEKPMSTITRNNRYQEGSIDRVKRAKGRPDVWVYRWRELQEDGSRVQRKKTIGDTNRYPKRADAKRAVENLRAEETFITEVSPVAVERWLRKLPYAPSTKSKLRNQLSALFSHAIRHRLFTGENPIATVRQGSKRLRDPDILTLGEMQTIIQGLTDPMHRIAVLIAAVTVCVALRSEV